MNLDDARVMRLSRRGGPSWNTLFDTASSQHGYFTTEQASEAGYSAPLLVHYTTTRRIERVSRGIYRLVHYPAGDHEELVVAWLWSGRTGVISHHTALFLHGLSDALPTHIHLTVPASWRRRRLRVPRGAVLHHGDVDLNERFWFGAVPTTNVLRTLNDCAGANLAPDMLQQAVDQAIARGLIDRKDLATVSAALKPY